MRNRSLNRFLEAQNAHAPNFEAFPFICPLTVYEKAVGELLVGRKVTHWMWFIFPQRLGLGESETSRYYGIRSDREASKYAAHRVLGCRLLVCHEIVQAHLRKGRTLEEIFGPTDAQKYQSCVDLFHMGGLRV